MVSKLKLPPSSESTVEVSVIHGGRIAIPASFQFKNPIPGHDFLDAPCYSFIIENKEQGEKVLFDLGLMKAWKEKQPPSILDQIKFAGAQVEAEQDVADQLNKAGVPLESINAIIWSHHHIDHTGDPSIFPPSTSLVVGPGFKSNKLTFPGYPANPDALVADDAFHGREVIELEFTTSSINILGFPAIDYFNDGSFYILQSQGHTDDHISALARTSSNKFIFLGGDISHHPGEYRPTTHNPLPDEIRPPPFDHNIHSSAFCPGALFKDLHPRTKSDRDYKTTPFLEPLEGVNINPADAQIAVEKMELIDASAEILVIIAHDASLLDVLGFFPEKLNDWHLAGYKGLGMWRFLRDFSNGLGQS